MQNKTREVVLVGMFAAVLAVISQVSIPFPTGVPLTLQTFAVVFMGVVLGWKRATIALVIYILVGAVGVPVFSGLKGGVQALLHLTGGFIWGFIPLVILSGLTFKDKKIILTYIVSLMGLLLCHICGVTQFSIVSGRGVLDSFLIVSAPYLVKDILFVILGVLVGKKVRIRLVRNSLL